jgi:N-acylneuraminate cytidylyltransferase
MPNPKILTVIPARGGSKRIPKKNIIDFCGKPMIAWPIELLQSIKVLDEIIVSTDSEEIAQIVKNLGAKVPFSRPRELSDDYTGTTAVIKHAVEWYMANVGPVDYVLTVYPTAVFLSTKDIEKAFDLLRSSGSEIVFPGTEYPSPIQRAIYLDDQQRVAMFQPEHFTSRSQDLQTAYHDAGQFYFSKISAVLNETPFFSHTARMIVIPRHRVVDIDTMDDLKLATKLFEITQKMA